MGELMQVKQTHISGLNVVQSTHIADNRGAFSRLFCEKELANVVGENRIVQINKSRTLTVGAIRGLHYQRPPHSEMKLVRCLRGRVWDIAVDLRRDSPSFLKWYAEELTPGNNLMVVIPEGFAHGFQVLEPDSELLYLHTAFYMPEVEGGLRYDDPRLSINWPLAVTEISPRDAAHTLIDSNFSGIRL